MFRQSVKKLIERSTQTTSTKTNVFNTNSKRKMSGGGSIEEEIAEMNKWRTVTFLAIPACCAFGVYSFASAEHGHGGEQPAYSYLKRRSREQWPWGGDLGLFEYPKSDDGHGHH